MAPDSSEILELVGLLHEGIADESVWDRAFQGVMGMTGMDVYLVGTVGSGGRDVRFHFGNRASIPAARILEGPLADPAHNPWISVGLRHPLRRPATVEDMGGQAVLERSRLWTEFYKPFDITDTIGATIERQPEAADIMMIGRRGRKSGFGRAGRDAFVALLPHIARAWRVRRMLGEWQDMAGTLKLVLDRLDRGVVVTDAEGKVRFANGAADRLLTRGDVLDVTGGRIRGKRSADSRELLGLVQRAARTAVGADSIATDALAVSGDGEGPNLAIVAEPLAAAHSDSLGHRSEAGAVLFISDSEACTSPSSERLRIVYGLTPAEARLAALVVEGQDNASAARSLGVSANTVKFHLKTIFDKVGVGRQAELVRRVLADVGGLAEPEKLVPSRAPPGEPGPAGMASGD